VGVQFSILGDVVTEPSHSFFGLCYITIQFRLNGFGPGGLYEDVFGFTNSQSVAKVVGPLGESIYGVLVFRLAVGLVPIRCGY